MNITLSPQRTDETLIVIKNGDSLTINDVIYDFSAIPDGATLPKSAFDCRWIISDVERVNGVINLTLILPHAVNASEQARYPSPIINPADGPLELPK